VASRGQWQQGAPGRIGCKWHEWQEVQLYTERLVAAVDEAGDRETQVATWVAREITNRSGTAMRARANSGKQWQR
jgi:hypothetical protein